VRERKEVRDATQFYSQVLQFQLILLTNAGK